MRGANKVVCEQGGGGCSVKPPESPPLFEKLLGGAFSHGIIFLETPIISTPRCFWATTSFGVQIRWSV